jgi:pyridoxal phosphate enzyme (YggS family)
MHTIDRLKIAERLSVQREPHARLGPLQVCVQVNISGEESKSGVHPSEALALCEQIAPLRGLTLRGLMAIPEPTQNPNEQRKSFAAVRELFKSIRMQKEMAAGFHNFDTLSMGMSEDLEAAIAEGATMIRVGSAIFGQRPPSAKIEA